MEQTRSSDLSAPAMSRILDMNVLEEKFICTEDVKRETAPGVHWRRRRYKFFVKEVASGTTRPEALCINETFVTAGAEAVIRPTLASQFPKLCQIAEIENAYWATTFAKGALRTYATERETRLYVNVANLLYAEKGTDTRPICEALQRGQENDFKSTRDLDAVDILDPQLIEEKDDRFGVARYLPAFPLSRIMENDSNVIAAINAGYFLNFPEEYDDGISALHQPVGGHIINGRMVAPPWIDRPGILRTKNGRTLARIFGPSDMEICIGSLPPVGLHKAGKGPAHGTVLRFFEETNFTIPPNAVALHFTGPLLVCASGDYGTSQAPPRGGATIIVDGHHAREALADPRSISLRLKPEISATPDWMISAGPFLVRNQRQIYAKDMLSPDNAGEFRAGGPPPTRFPYDVEKTRAPRTAFGNTADGGYKLIVVDGRSPGTHSCGVTLSGIAAVMELAGCEAAINLDGGGSSVMAVAGLSGVETLRTGFPPSIVNIPSDDGGRERIVPVLLTVVRNS